jgi:imidazoleglycerol-phosphate dehydratase
MMKRKVELKRETSETSVSLALDLDGKGDYRISTTIPFLDHMLSLMAKHGFFDVTLQAKGDTQVDMHHTVEDIGIMLGQGFKQAIGKGKGICRYGCSSVPMDEALADVSLDVCNRPFLVINLPPLNPKVGEFDAELVKVFFQAFVANSGITLHANVRYGENTHHVIESIFKAFGRALAEAVKVDERVKGVLSTKGTF